MYDEIAILVSIAGLFLSLVGLLLVVAALYQAALIHKRSVDAQMFLEFTSRFSNMPEFLELLTHDKLNTPFQQTPQNIKATCHYFNLICHEFYLNQEKILSDKIWKMWQRDIKNIITSKFMIESWEQDARPRYEHLIAFTRYVDEMMKSPRLD